MNGARAVTSLKLVALTALLLLASGWGSALGQPLISDFTPSVGAAGDQVTLYGRGFSLPGITVRFWSQKVATINYVSSDTQMTVTVPSGISTGPISIRQGSGPELFSAFDFTAIGPEPYLIAVVPLYARTNELVVIAGVHFTGVVKNGVSFNGQKSTDAAVNADGTHINVHVPYGASSGFITVTTPRGTGTNPEPFTVIGPGPYVASLSPQVGTAGTTVMLNGVNFAGVTTVNFNSTPGVNLFVQSDTLILVDAPPGVTSGPLTIKSPTGSFTTAQYFFIPPKITGFSPTAGRANTNVTITGVNFLGATSVSFNGLESTYFSVLSNTNISVAVPSGAVSGTVRAVAPAGSAFSSSNFVVQPTIFSFSPSFGPAGTAVVLSGANFNVGTPVIRFNGVAAAAPSAVSFGQLTVVVPAGTTSGRISISTSDGNHTNVNSFYLPASITGFTPTNSPPGTRITVTGQNFTGATGVDFNGTPAAGFTVTNNTTLGATVPAGVTTGSISVTTPAGSVSSSKLFYGAPNIAGFTPTHGLPGTNVVISGVNFVGATAVRFNGTGAKFTVNNNGQITATVPNAASSGPISIVAPAGTNSSSSNFILDYFSDLTVSILGAPNPAVVGSNLLYTIKVTNNGPLAAPNVRVTLTVPSSVAFRSVTAPTAWFVATKGDKLESVTGNLSAKASATFLVTVAPQSAGSITSTVSTGSDYSDPNLNDNTTAASTAVEPLALLSIRVLSKQVQIGWSSLLTNHMLEFKSLLTTNSSWSKVTIPPVVSGSVKSVTVTNPGPAGFYRLRK